MVLTLGTVMLFSRSLTRPLRQITHAVEQLGRGAVEPNLPLRARDEAGVLARAFDEMSRQVREHDASMKKEVGVRRRAEEALREAERQLRLALDAAQAGVGDTVLVLKEGTGVRQILTGDIHGLLPILETIVGIVDRVDVPGAP